MAQDNAVHILNVLGTPTLFDIHGNSLGGVGGADTALRAGEVGFSAAIPLTEVAEPADADPGTQRLYIDSTTHKLTRKDENSVVTEIEGGGGSSPRFQFLGAAGISGTGAGQYMKPQGIAFAPDGTWYLADALRNDVQIYNMAQDDVIGRFGSSGSGDGEFDAPLDVAVSPDGLIVYVLDSGNSRIQRFDASGVFIDAFGTSGTGNGQFTFFEGNGIAVSPAGIVYVTDYGSVNTARVQRFTAAGVYMDTFGISGPGQLSQGPWGIGINPAGTIIYVGNGDGATVANVMRYQADGTFIDSFGTTGTADGEFVYPISIAVAANGNVYVSDSNTGFNRVQIFTASGVFIDKFGSSGDGLGEFDDAGYLWVALCPSDGEVYVSEAENRRIQKFSAAGEYEGMIGVFPITAFQVRLP